MTKPRQSSKTALMVAALRGRASLRGPLDRPVCADPFALALAGAEGEALADSYARYFPNAELYLGVRTAFLDQQVLRFTRGERFCPQVVILGAGLDTRSARLGAAGVRFFEVDHPASQADKIARIEALAMPYAGRPTYVACDFETDDFFERLVAAGFDPGTPAFFLWEGVSYYLTEPAVRATLGRVARGADPKSVIVFDFVAKNIIDGTRLRANHVAAKELVERLSEPFKWGTNDVLPLLYEEGFRHVRTTSCDEACLTLTGTYERVREFRFQQFGLASVAPEPFGF